MGSEVRSITQLLAHWLMLAALLIASSGASLVLVGQAGASTAPTAQEEVEERLPYACQRHSAVRRVTGFVRPVDAKPVLHHRPVTSLGQVRCFPGHRIAGGLLAPILC